MAIEEVARFLRETPPFSLLPDAALAAVSRKIQIEYFPAEHNVLIREGAPAQFLYVICRGSVDVLREYEGTPVVLDTLDAGDVFGEVSLIYEQPPIATVRTREEMLAYLLPAAEFHRLRREQLAFSHYFTASKIERLNLALRSHQQHDAAQDLFQLRLRDIVGRGIITVPHTATIREVAAIMAEHNVSSVIITSNPEGIVSDRDLRNRVVAKGLDYNQPITTIMTSPVLSLPDDSLLFEALSFMLERHIHHMPVTVQGKIAGMVTDTDILRQQSNSPMLLPRQLERADTSGDLRRYTDQVEVAAIHLLKSGARVRDIGRVVALAHGALLRRLITNAEAELGAPPCPYAWVVVGSEGRYEQTLRTDQDNGLIYADHAPAAADGYFAALATKVVEQLVQCGFPLCPGNIMATNPQWRQPLSVWSGYFHDWLHNPNEEALLQAAIFFDLRKGYGTLEIEPVLRPVIESARQQKIFLARLARTSLRQTPPLGFFRNFVVERDGAERDLIDLKERGTALVVEMARIYALASGVPATNTFARLEMASLEGSISTGLAEELAAAYELISLLRLEHQVALCERGEQPNNRVPISELTTLQQRDLKEAFRTVRKAQKALEFTFQTGMLG